MTHIVRPKGRLDAITAGAFEQELRPHLDSSDSHLVIDLSSVPYISSAGLRVILLAAQTLMHDGTLTLVAPNQNVREVLEIAGFQHFAELLECMPALPLEVC